MFNSLRYSRRDWLTISMLGSTGISQSGWLQSLASDVTKKGTSGSRNHKSIILLWLNGGPATIDLWDLKTKHENGGPFREIETSVNGIKISEHLPNLAKHMKDMAIIRSMATREGDHRRARIVGLTGYTPQGAIQFPALGALVAHEFHDPQADLPGFVSVGGRVSEDIGGGFLGPKFSPFVVGSAARRPSAGDAADLFVPDLGKPEGVTSEEYTRRLNLLKKIDLEFNTGKGNKVVETIRLANDQAVRLMRPEAAGAFRLEDEKENLRDTYGRNNFGQGCLLARRLVERGVPFVEVSLDGWDTHQDNFERVKKLSTILDTGFSALLTDLKERGMLDHTLVVCMGEFGRTPRINGSKGRDHWSASWSTVLAGGGLKTGQVIGKTSKDGTEVTSDPTRTPDLIATIVKAVGIDPTKQNMSNVSRPIRIADPSAKLIKELL